MRDLDVWLAPALTGKSSLAALTDLEGSVRSLIPYDTPAPARPAGASEVRGADCSRFTIDYTAEGGPRVDVRVAGTLRPLRPSRRRRRQGAADPGAALAGASPDPVDQGSARLLAWLVERGAQGDARPLPPSTPGRKTRRRLRRQPGPSRAARSRRTSVLLQHRVGLLVDLRLFRLRHPPGLYRLAGAGLGVAGRAACPLSDIRACPARRIPTSECACGASVSSSAMVRSSCR